MFSVNYLKIHFYEGMNSLDVLHALEVLDYLGEITLPDLPSPLQSSSSL